MKPKADLIRAKMVKYPKVYLWDKSNWTKEDLLKFKKLNIPTNRFKIKVLRVSYRGLARLPKRELIMKTKI